MKSNKESTDGTESTFTVWDFVNVLRRRWLVILAVFVCVSLLGTYRTMQKTYVYRAQAKLAFNLIPSMPPFYGARARYAPSGSFSSYFRAQEEIIKSEPVARRVAESLKLIRDHNNKKQVEAAIAKILGSLSIKHLEDRDMILVRSISPDPLMAQKIANATAEAYIRYNDDKKYLAYRKSIQGITEQLADLEKKLNEAQQDLIAFIKKEKITSYGDGQSVLGTYRGKLGDEVEVRNSIEKLNNERVAAEVELSKLKEKYLDGHPEVKKLKNDLKILNKKIKEEEARLLKLKAASEKDTIKAKEKEIQYSILQRKVDVNKQLYNTLIRNLKETDIGSEIATTDVEIIEYAKKPTFPFAPNKTKEVFFTLFLGLLLGLAVGIILQHVDSSFKNAEDLESYIKYPLLASIPRFRAKGKKKILLLGDKAEEEGLREYFRLLRTNLRFALSEKPGKHIVITSSQKGEGKSTVTVNLGVVMAEAGTKTLLVDSDMRIRSLKAFFTLEDKKGLSDYLQGKADIDEVISETGIDNLYVVPAGSQVQNPSLLFESDLMKKFIKESGDRFESILFDAPPVGLVVDASIFGDLVGGTILLVEAESVTKKAVLAAIERIVKGKAFIYGTVFNKEAYRSSSYYYRYYKSYPYGREKNA